MENKNINIEIQNEISKEELIHNNVVSNLDLSLEEEVNYLRYRVSTLERDLKARMMYAILLLSAFVILCTGIILVINDIYLIGTFFILFAFGFVVVKFYLQLKKEINKSSRAEFHKIEQMKKRLEEKLR